MFFRISVIGMVTAGVLLSGIGANAETLPGASPELGPSAGAQHVTVVNVYGNNNVIAADRSVVSAGDHGRLNANTGDVSSSGNLGIDSENSALESGASTNGMGRVPVGPSEPVSPSAREKTAAPAPPPAPASEDGGTSISGYEDHSVNVSGEDQITAYDDSNLFVNRNGKLNANTGDTDSSGLNAVDVSGSTVKSGNHTEDGENGDDDEDAAEEAAAAARPAGTPATQPSAPVRQTASPTGPQPGPGGQVSSTVTDEGESNATGKGAFTIGADGYDNVAAKVQGKRNTVAYDDSNVVAGGTGDVNAQIGDSDTSGAVVMGVKDSDVRAGNST